MLPFNVIDYEDRSHRDGIGGSVSGSSYVESLSNLGSEQSSVVRDTIIRHEERAVRKTRFLVCFTILSCAVGIILAVHFLSKQSDLRSFELEVSIFRFLGKVNITAS
jgi:hypothetical protein